MIFCIGYVARTTTSNPVTCSNPAQEGSRYCKGHNDRWLSLNPTRR
jgi:hypothetical protein